MIAARSGFGLLSPDISLLRSCITANFLPRDGHRSEGSRCLMRLPHYPREIVSATIRSWAWQVRAAWGWFTAPSI